MRERVNGVIDMLVGISVIAVQGKQQPKTNARYAALGSSFAAGIGLGERAPRQPHLLPEKCQWLAYWLKT